MISALTTLRRYAGIADPAAFYKSLEREGVSPVATLAFSDHCRIGEHDIAALCRLKEASRADFMITTGKDAVKLSPYLERLGTVYVAVLELRLAENGALAAALEKLL